MPGAPARSDPFAEHAEPSSRPPCMAVELPDGPEQMSKPAIDLVCRERKEEEQGHLGRQRRNDASFRSLALFSGVVEATVPLPEEASKETADITPAAA